MKYLEENWIYVFMFFALLAVLFGGCKNNSLKELKAPVILVAVGDCGCNNSKCITVRDSSGTLYSFDCANTFSYAVSQSRVIGDTLSY